VSVEWMPTQLGSIYFILFLTFIEPQGASFVELDQPSPQFHGDRPPSVKVHGRIEGHSNLVLVEQGRRIKSNRVDLKTSHNAWSDADV